MRAKLWRARAALAWEHVWPALSPALAVVGLFAAVTFFDLLPRLPGWLHALVLVGFAAALVTALWRARRAFHLPEEDAGRRRLEVASGMAHRPLVTLNDSLSSGTRDAEAAALWQIHRDRVRAALARVRVGWPAPNLARRDPYALRAALLLLVVIALGFAGSDWEGRVARAVTPDLAGANSGPGALDLWITPPAYTGLAPLLPKMDPTGTASTIAVPSGSTLLAQVSGGRGVPHLRIDDKSEAFSAVDQTAHRITTQIDGGSKLVVEQNGRPLGSWTLHVIPDRVPTVKFANVPMQARRGALRLEYEAADDYGLVSVGATVRRAEPPASAAPDEAIELPLTLPRRVPGRARAELSRPDLASMGGAQGRHSVARHRRGRPDRRVGGLLRWSCQSGCSSTRSRAPSSSSARRWWPSPTNVMW